MKKLISLSTIILMTIILVGCSQPRVEIGNLDDRMEQYMEYETPIFVHGKPFSGIAYETYNNQVYLEVSFKNGVPHGPFEEYFGNGQLELKGNFKDGVVDGPFEEYFRNGQLDAKGTYKDGQKEGQWVEYFDDGRIYHSGTGMFKNGEKISD